MANAQSVAPRLPTAPQDYDAEFMSDLVRSLELFIVQERNPGEERATKITFTNLPTSDTGLEEGALYRIGNNVKISLIDMAVPDSFSVEASLGSVTVSVT